MSTEPRTYKGSRTTAVLQLHAAGAPVRTIAEGLKLSTQYVYRVLSRYGETPNPPEQF